MQQQTCRCVCVSVCVRQRTPLLLKKGGTGIYDDRTINKKKSAPSFDIVQLCLDSQDRFPVPCIALVFCCYCFWVSKALHCSGLFWPCDFVIGAPSSLTCVPVFSQFLPWSWENFSFAVGLSEPFSSCHGLFSLSPTKAASSNIQWTTVLQVPTARRRMCKATAACVTCCFLI